MRISRGLFLLVLAQGLAGCGSSSAPSAPSPVPQAAPPPIPISLVVFTDPVSRASTSDVRDAQEQIVRFNTAGELVWTADGTRFPGYRVNGNAVGSEGLEVRFGTKDGERRAYLIYSLAYYHYTLPEIVVDLEVVDGKLVVTTTKAPVAVPGTAADVPSVSMTVSPNTGSTGGSTPVTLTGTGFQSGATVTLDGTAILRGQPYETRSESHGTDGRRVSVRRE